MHNCIKQRVANSNLDLRKALLQDANDQIRVPETSVFGTRMWSLNIRMKGGDGVTRAWSSATKYSCSEPEHEYLIAEVLFCVFSLFIATKGP